jgi:lipid II:glycine glycyltransferase (peptidoglycan interpeptide bridge formation enzyme)
MLSIIEDGDFSAFWKILEERLQGKYSVAPVHSLEEITLLKSRFPENIKLFCVADNNGEILGGVVLFITDNVVHMQYSATTDKGRRISALDYLYEELINNRFAGKEYFDFGISVEDGGRYLNSGLIAYKERLGGRAVVYDTYTIDLKERYI